MDWCLDLYLFWGGGGGECSYEIEFCLGWGWFYLEFLGDYFLLRGFFYYFFCSGTLLIFVQHSLIHSHIFFMYLGKVEVLCFFVFEQQQLNNCFWKIRVALRRAGLV